MIVLKFGGSSVANADCIRQMTAVVRKSYESSPALVVVSAMGGVTDKLNELTAMAVAGKDYSTAFEALQSRHLQCQIDLFEGKEDQNSSIRDRCTELQSILNAISALGECSPSIKARILGFGERLSSDLIHRYWSHSGLENTLLDSTAVIRASGDPLDSRVAFQETETLIRKALGANPQGLSLAPGFIASNAEGQQVTLGRGGSDYSAALFAAALDAERLEIWTDVPGILTAEPGLVRSAYPIPELGYEEVMELSHFGAKVIHPPSVQPVFAKGIPILVKNTFEPEAEGTRITRRPPDEGGVVRGTSCIPGISLLTVLGSGMVGVPGTAERVFGALSRAKLNVLFISQSSSEHSICLGVKDEDADRAKTAIERDFEPEIALGRVEPVRIEPGLAILAVVGEKMRQRAGLAGRAFSLLGENGINIRAIAQGSTERNISMVIETRDRAKALNVLHEGFFLSPSKRVHLFCVGTGGVGSELFKQLAEQRDFLLQEHVLDVRLAGVSNSRKMLVDPEGIDPANWEEELEQRGEPADLRAFVGRVKSLNLRNSCFVDNSASAQVAATYEQLLSENVSVVASNKIAAASPFPDYLKLQQTARNSGAHWLYETNVAAGLPVLRTIEDLLRSGDRIHRIEAVVSGTLNYITNTISEEVPVSQAVEMARDVGLTEPDPAIDLSGLDVIRKVTILARLCGTPMEIEAVESKSFLPVESVGAYSEAELLEELRRLDPGFEKQRQNAAASGSRLRMTAVLEEGRASVGLRAVDSSHPAFELEGMDNIILVHSDRYRDQPLVIKGAGAGPDVTAAGVFADILRYAHI